MNMILFEYNLNQINLNFKTKTIADPWYSYMKPNIHKIESDVLAGTSEIVYPTYQLKQFNINLIKLQIEIGLWH